jgi:hypothetical protein
MFYMVQAALEHLPSCGAIANSASVTAYQDLENAPDFAKTDWPDFDDHNYANEVHGYFGSTPTSGTKMNNPPRHDGAVQKVSDYPWSDRPWFGQPMKWRRGGATIAPPGAISLFTDRANPRRIAWQTPRNRQNRRHHHHAGGPLSGWMHRGPGR